MRRERSIARGQRRCLPLRRLQQWPRLPMGADVLQRGAGAPHYLLHFPNGGRLGLRQLLRRRQHVRAAVTQPARKRHPRSAGRNRTSGTAPVHLRRIRHYGRICEHVRLCQSRRSTASRQPRHDAFYGRPVVSCSSCRGLQLAHGRRRGERHRRVRYIRL